MKTGAIIEHPDIRRMLMTMRAYTEATRALAYVTASAMDNARRHPDAVAIFMTDVNGKFTFPNAPTQDISRKAGDVLWTPAITHQPENVGNQPFEVILVELKSKAPARSTKKANHAALRRR